MAAAIVAPVEPGLTIASARPSATSAAARTTEASFLARTAGTGSSSLPIHSRGRDDLDPVDAVEAELVGRAEDAQPDPVGGGQPRALGEHVEALLGAEAVEGDGHAAPGRHRYSASGAAPRSDRRPCADHLTPGVGAAGRADPVRQARAVAARAAG